MKSKEYHDLVEALLQAALREKNLSRHPGKTGHKAAGERLEICGEALRSVVVHGVSKLKVNTVRLVIDHIDDILLESEGEVDEPLALQYIQILGIILEHPVHVENLALLDAGGWLACADLLVSRLSRLLESADSSSSGPGTISRDSPAPGTARQSSVSRANGQSRVSSQRGGVQLTHSEVSPLVQSLQSLVSASNAPCMARRQEISSALLRVLRLRLNFGKVQRAAFAGLNCILLKTAGDDPAFGQATTTEVIPLLSYWWQIRGADNDELLFSVKDEILKTIHAVHLYLDSLLQEASSAALLAAIEDLLDSLWTEYSQRSLQSRLRLEDLTFSSTAFPSGHFSTSLFILRPFTQDAERRWAIVDTMARLEGMFLRHASSNSQRPRFEDLGVQPRKKQRFAGGSHRIHQKMMSSDPAVRFSAFQLIPFFLPLSIAPTEDILTFVEDLLPAISDKQGMLSSWAMIACAR